MDVQDQKKTRIQLIRELDALRREIDELKRAGSGRIQTVGLLHTIDKYRLMVEYASQGILVLQGDMIRYANSRVADFTGYSMEELYSLPVSTFIHPDDRTLVFERRKRRTRGEEESAGRIRIVRKDGSIRWVESYGMLIQWDGGPATLNYAWDITERKNAEDKLRASEDKFRILSETIPAMIFVHQGDVFLYVNSSMEKTMEYSRDELLRMNFWESVHPDFREMVKERGLARWRGEKVPASYEIKFLTKSGKERWVYISAGIIEYKGKPAVLGTAFDITQRKRIEEACREQADLYRILLEESLVGVYIIQNGRFQFMNSTAASAAGHTPEEMIGRNFDAIVHPDDIERVKCNAKEILRGKPPSACEFRIIDKQGRIRWVMETITPIHYQGRPAVLGNSMDITEKKQAEEALIRSEEKYRLLVTFSMDGIFIAQDGVVKFPNPKIQKLLGYSEVELSRIPFDQHIHPDDCVAVIERHRRLLSGEKFPGQFITCRMINRSGQEFWVEISSDMILWEGRPATFNFVRDITSQKKLESQLLQAQKMESIGTLAGGIAHDFNNLLMGIQGYASLMLLDIDPAHPHYEKLKNIENQVRHGMELNSQLLGFARGGKYEAKPTNMNKFLRVSSEMFGRTKKEIAIHTKYQENIWPVEIDRSQIDQVMLNLFINAWQAMPGGGEIYLETLNVDLDEETVKPHGTRAGKYVRISVTDTGIGMDEKTRQRIFDPFFTTKELKRGTGLGLASAYGIIKNHGGFITVYSEKGKGSTFNIYLPASEKALAPDDTASHEILKGKETILVVDDEKINVEVTAEILKRLDYTVYTAESGEEAIAVLKENRDRIDLVLLDMVMPHLSGAKAFQAMREIKPDVKVILASGYSINSEAKMIMEQGCNGFMQKPFTVYELSRKIRDVLGH
ncbi:MAG: PAS domain S-box protein [Syntrophales bacterium]